MPRFADKETLVEAMVGEWSRLMDAFGSLDPAEAAAPGVSGAGRWSAKDTIAHVTEWQQMVLAWYRAGQKGETPKTPATDLNWRQLPELNRRIFEKHRGRSLKEVMEGATRSHKEILRVVRAMPEADLLVVGRFAWLGKVPLVSYVASCTSSHYRWARTRIVRWRKARARSAAVGCPS